MSQGAQTIIQGEVVDETWGSMLTIIDLAASLVVNALATGLIVFKILKVYLEIKATSVEQTFNSSSSTGGTKLRHILFVIIESGMALFAIQLARVVVTCVIESQAGTPPNLQIALDLIISIHEMLNVIIRSVPFVLLMTFTCPGHRTNNNFGPGFNEIVLRRRRILQWSCQKSDF